MESKIGFGLQEVEGEKSEISGTGRKLQTLVKLVRIRER